jgi:protein-tyrosine kinase
MSLVYKALCRAAELASRDEGFHAAETLKPLSSSDTSRLTGDAFLLETSDTGMHAQRGFEAQLLPSNPPLKTEPSAVSAGPPDLRGSHSSADPWWVTSPAGLSQKIVIDHDISPVSREQYRLLAATLHNAQVSKGVKVIMIASAVAGEGKTLTAVNLALTFSESYHRRVLLADGDLRRPVLHRLFGCDSNGRVESPPSPGEQRFRIQSMTPLFGILIANSPISAPMAELTSKQMQQVLKDAREAFDWIILDTPPVTLLPDASLLASIVDGAVLVVRAESTPVDLVKRAVEGIGRQKLLGVLLNGAKTRSHVQDYPHGRYEHQAGATGRS